MARGVCAIGLMLLLAAAACHKTDSKEAQLKALDEAYKSGVFTKEEYDAKKQALMGTAAAVPAPAAPPVAAPPAADATPPAPALPDPNTALPSSNPAPAQAPPPAASYTPPPGVSAPPSSAPRRAAAAPPAQAQTYQPPASGAEPGYPPLSVPPAPTPAAPPPAMAPPAAAAPDQPAEPEPAPSSGCQDAESRAGGPNGAQERFFPASEDAVRRAAIQALTTLNFAIGNSTTHDMEASKKGRLNTVVGGGTEKVTLHFSTVRHNGQVETRVVGDTKRGFMGRVTQKSWTSAVLAQIACNLR